MTARRKISAGGFVRPFFPAPPLTIRKTEGKRGRHMLNVLSAWHDGRLTVFLHGELDHHEVRQSMGAIERLLDEYLPRDCVLDLSDLKFMDSSGIALILKLHRRMRERGGRAWVENAAQQPLRVIDASGIERLVRIASSEEARK